MESLVIGKIFGEVDEIGNNFLQEICDEGCLGLLLRAGFWLDDKASEVLLQNYNFNGDQCVHIVAKVHRGLKAILLMEALVDLGANINEPDRISGATALHIAVVHEDHQLADWICRQDGVVDKEARDYAGMTAFQVAWKRRDLKMVDLLWELGADGDQPWESDSESDDEC